MAQTTNTLDAYDLNTNREDLADIIYDISPTETPFCSNVGRHSSDATYKEWTIDSLAAAADNAHIDGDEFSGDALTDGNKVGNYHQISRKDLVVTRRSNVVNKAGQKSAIARQVAKAGKELKRDIELAATKRKVAVVGDATTAMQSAGVPAWIRTNDQLGSGGSSPTLSGTTSGYVNGAGTVGTARALSEATLMDAIRGCFDQGGNPNMIMASTEMKQRMSTFLFSSSSRVATQYQDQGKKASGGATVIGAVDVYVTDFGVVEIVPNRFSPSGATTSEVFVLDTEYWAISYLDGFKTETIAKIGDHERRMLLADWTVESNNEAASAVVAAINDTTAMTA